MNPKEISDLRSKAKNLDPLVRVGKNGITDNQLIEISKLLEKRKLIKIKMLKSFAEGKDAKETACDIAQKTQSTIIECIGHVLVLYKK